MKKDRLLVLFFCFSVLGGCSVFSRLEKPKGSRFIVGERIETTEITEGSRELLLRENLLALYEENPEETLKQLIGRILADRSKQEDPRCLFCAAELANAVAERKTSRWNRRPIIYPRIDRKRFRPFGQERFLRFLSKNEDILVYYGMATYLSYSYLAFAHEKLETEMYSPRFSRACSLYNYSLSQTIRYTLKRYPHLPGSSNRLDDLQSQSQIQFELVGFEWPKEDIDDLLMAEDYADTDVTLKTRRFGLGVPMIGIRYADESSDLDLYPSVATFPISALYIPNESYDLEVTEERENVHLVNPWVQETLQVGRSVIPVETDLTTPLNYLFEANGFNDNILKGYLGGETDLRAEVKLLQPHQRGRIPIVLIHGLLASPVSWEVFMNGLMDDPWIRRNYEFWFARYPTGRGFLYNARDLRKSIASILERLDPSNSDPGLKHMVLVGHSMGGILSTFLSHASGDSVWNEFWKVPIDRLDLTHEEERELRELFFFEPIPSVHAVIYLGTPHRGSPLAANPLGRVGSRLIDLPSQTRNWLKAIGDRNQELAKVPLNEQSFNSASDLRPNSPPIRALQQLPSPPDIAFFNFAGNIKGEGKEGSDGIVPLESAILESADFQEVVAAKHTEIHSHPQVIEKVKEILHRHIESEDPSTNPARTTRSTIPEIESGS